MNFIKFLTILCATLLIQANATEERKAPRTLRLRLTIPQKTEPDVSPPISALIKVEDVDPQISRVEFLQNKIFDSLIPYQIRFRYFADLAEYAQSGHGLAMAYMSLFFLEGVKTVVGKDADAYKEMGQKALPWLESNISRELPCIYNIYGLMFYNGFCGVVPVDKILGIAYLEKAAGAGYKDAIHNLSLIHAGKK
jgi:TPR repeat protein